MENKIISFLRKANPLKCWRARREARRDMELRKFCLEKAMSNRNPLPLAIDLANILYLYLRYGVSEDGIPVKDIFHESKWEQDCIYPARAIKL